MKQSIIFVSIYVFLILCVSYISHKVGNLQGQLRQLEISNRVDSLEGKSKTHDQNFIILNNWITQKADPVINAVIQSARK